MAFGIAKELIFHYHSILGAALSWWKKQARIRKKQFYLIRLTCEQVFL
jgi:hypothetical protein